LGKCKQQETMFCAQAIKVSNLRKVFPAPAAGSGKGKKTADDDAAESIVAVHRLSLGAKTTH
jgi:hypothetical protein